MSKRARIALFVAFAACIAAIEPLDLQAQEVLLRKDAISTELFLRISTQSVSSIEQDGTKVIVHFKDNIEKPFNQRFDDKYIQSITGSGKQLIITLKGNTDFGAFYDPHGLRFIAAHQRQLDNVLLSYGVGAPMLRKDNIRIEDPALDAQLALADNYKRDKRFPEAVAILRGLISSNNPFYAQDASFRLGSVYMDMGATIPTAFLEAGLAYDEFVKRFPDSNRVLQAKILSALAKESSGDMSSAISTYRDIYAYSSDMETRRHALIRIAELYQELHDNPHAIEAYENYVSVFKAEADDVRNILGKLYLNEELIDKAYRLYENASVASVSDMLDDSQLLALARVFKDKGVPQKAIDIYQQLTSKSSPEAVSAWEDLAETYRMVGDVPRLTEALVNLMAVAGITESGLRARVDFAELNVNARTADEWKDFFAPIYTDDAESYGLRPRTEMVLLKALQNDGDAVRLAAKIDEYLAFYANDEQNAELSKLKEQMLFDKGVAFQEAKEYEGAVVMYRQILASFPDSPHKDAIQKNIDDIYYSIAHDKFDAGNFYQAITDVEDWMVNHTDNKTNRWTALWEDSMYQYVTSTASLSPKMLRYRARVYLAYAPRGKYVRDMRRLLEQSFSMDLSDAYASGGNAKLLDLYQENYPWLDLWPDQSFNNRAKIFVAKTLLNVGMPNEAARLYDDIVPTTDPIYANIGYTLCRNNVVYNINNLTAEEFKTIVQETAGCKKPEYTIALLDKYTANRPLALKMRYDIAKLTTDDVKREAEFRHIYLQLTTNSGNVFDGCEEVYLETGMLEYKRNNFTSALSPLQYYVDNTKDDGQDNQKKAQALYYIARSLINLNEHDRAVDYFRQIVAMPGESTYKVMAQSELENEKWQKGDAQQG
ncbi:hypothetical protein AGMMS49941_01920 [Deferribacterales bacterium]|nr:hypothetical protein AGMMS49941_01920 [Deferribacterales bacterium]